MHMLASNYINIRCRRKFYAVGYILYYIKIIENFLNNNKYKNINININIIINNIKYKYKFLYVYLMNTYDDCQKFQKKKRIQYCN